MITFTIRLDGDQLQQLRRLAHTKSINLGKEITVADLIRQYIETALTKETK